VTIVNHSQEASHDCTKLTGHVVARYVVTVAESQPVVAGHVVAESQPVADSTQTLNVKARLMAGHDGVPAVAALLHELDADVAIETAQRVLAVCDGDTDESCATVRFLLNNGDWVLQSFVECGAKFPDLLVHGAQRARAGLLRADKHADA
jgi:hypothetical protein